MKMRRFAAATLVAGMIGLTSAVTVVPAHAADPGTVTGVACGPNEGVTVVVDFTPTADDVTMGCAGGAQDTIAAAMAAAGFVITTEPTAFGNYLCAIDGVAANPTDCQAFPGAYWAGWLNTDGDPGGPLGTTWTAANVGVDGGPLAVGTVVGYNLNTDGAFPGTPPRAALDSLPQPDNHQVPVPDHGPASGSAAAAGGWIGRQLVAGNGLISGSVGLTVDSIYALAAAGVGGDAIAQAAGAVRDSGSTYIGDADAVAAKFAQIAKVAFALQVAGLDPSTFPDGVGGSRDLLTELRSVLNPDGSFGSSDDPFKHAYAMVALGRTVGGVPAAAVSWLRGQQCGDAPAAGAFGYDGTCAGADPDYTALAVEGLLAAGVDPADSVIAAAAGWLAARQADGALDNTNTVGLVGQTFAATGAADAALAAAGFIGGLQVTCDMVLADGSLLTADNMGAIAWKSSALADGAQFGIDAGSLGQWQYASAQAVLGLGTPALGRLTAAGADPALPTAAACAPPVSDTTPATADVTTAATTTTITATTTATGAVSATPAAASLASTGVTDRTLPEVLIAVSLLVAGLVLVLVGRRRAADRRH